MTAGAFVAGYTDVAKGIMVSIDTAIPVSLIINELVTNSVKYAFPDGRTGNIHVNARVGEQDEAGTRIELSVHDDGIGLPQGFTMDTSHSLGMQLVQALTHQISGELKIDGTEGTTFLITFSGERQP